VYSLTTRCDPSKKRCWETLFSSLFCSLFGSEKESHQLKNSMPGPYYNLAGMLDANSLWSSLTCLFWTLLKPMTKMAVMFLSWLNWGGGYVEVTDLVPKKFLKQMTTYTRNEQVREKGGPGCLAFLGRFLLPSWGWLWPNHGTHLTNQPDWFLMGMGFKCTRALNQIRKPRSGDPTFCLCSCRVVFRCFDLIANPM